MPAVLGKLNLAKSEDLIAWTYADTVWARLAALAPIAFEEEKKGDAGISRGGLFVLFCLHIAC